MKVVFHESFHEVYTSDPAAAEGRMAAVLAALPTDTVIVPAVPATRDQLLLAHTSGHIDEVISDGLHDIAALAAGGAILTARVGLSEPCFGLIRPPGHHASADSAWGFCYYSNMAVALLTLRSELLIKTALVLDIDLHFGDGTDNILKGRSWATVFNPSTSTRPQYLDECRRVLAAAKVDIIGISAGFDHHRDDWGGLLLTEDYFTIGRMAADTARENGAGCFAILEGGYNHKVLGRNVAALMNGMSPG